MPLLLLETPRAGSWNHRFIIGRADQLTEAQLSSYVADARSQKIGQDYLAAGRMVLQSQGGRQGEEVLVLAGVNTAALDAGQQQALCTALAQLLADEVATLVTRTIAWPQDGAQNPVVRAELQTWAQTWQTLPAQPLRNPNAIPTRRKIMLLVAGLFFLTLAVAATQWLADMGLEDWQLGLKTVYPDAEHRQQAEAEWNTLGDGDKGRIKPLLVAWSKQPSTCSQLPMEGADALILWGSAPSQATLPCAKIVAARKALAKLTSQPSNTIALPFFTYDEKQHWEGYFSRWVTQAKSLSPTHQGDCAKPSTSDYQQLSCLARAASTTASPYQDSKNDLAYSGEACTELKLEGCSFAAPEVVEKAEELKAKAKKTWEAAQQQRQTALTPFKDFKLAGDEYKPLRQLLGLESSSHSPALSK